MRRPHRIALAAALVLAATGAGVPGAAWRTIVSRAAAATDAGVRARDATPAASPTRAAAGDAATSLAHGVHTTTIGAPDDTESERRRRGSRADGAVRVELAQPQAALGAALVVAGRDRAAPRALDLWRIAGDRSARVARGESLADGALAFPPILLPAGEVVLVATARGGRPNGASASAPVVVQRDPSAPHVVAMEANAAGALRLRVEPVEPAGAVVVSDGQGIVLATAAAASRAIDLVVPIAPGEAALHVAHVLPDGRRSPARRIEMFDSTPKLENEDAETSPFAP